MTFNLKLPSKVNEINLFKKENQGCTLYSYSVKNLITIVAELPEFEIPFDFYVDDKAINMLNLLAPIKSVNIDNICMTIKGTKGNYKARFIEGNITLPNLDLENKTTLDMYRLKIANRFTSNKETRPILTGVNIKSNGDIYATDSYMAYRYKSGVEAVELSEITIPRTFVDFIGSLFTENVELRFNSSSCLVKKDNVYYISRLLDGKYPDVERIFNNVKIGNKVVFDLEDLNEKLNIASVLEFNGDYSVINFKNNTIKVRTENPYDAEIVVNHDNDYEFNIALQRLKSVLINIDSNELKLNYEGALKQLYIEENGNEFILLPVKV